MLVADSINNQLIILNFFYLFAIYIFQRPELNTGALFLYDVPTLYLDRTIQWYFH